MISVRRAFNRATLLTVNEAGATLPEGSMKIAKLKKTRSAEKKKIDLAVKFQKEGKATGGGRIGPKKVRRSLEARNLPLQRKPAKPSNKQRAGRRRST
jgi:hypothetical protein